MTSGGSVSFTASPNSGYVVDQWLVNGGAVQTGGNSYTASNVTANRTVQITFKIAPAPALSISPSGLSQNCAQGQNAASQSFEVWNSGGGSMSYTLSDNVSWLSMTPTSGSSTGEHDTIQVNYSTSGLTAGSYSAAITVTASGVSGSPKTINVNLTVNAPAPEIAVEQPAGINISNGGSKDFGSLAVSSSASLTFTVRNTGTASLTGVGTSFSGGNSGDFSATSSPASTVAAGSTTTFTVRFVPGAAGTRSTTLRVTSSDADENPFDITLTGTGTSVGDSDGDGVPNTWETANGFNSNLASDVHNLDSDRDGDRDLLEIYQGTDRNNRNQCFGMQNTRCKVNGSTREIRTRYRRSTTQTAVVGTGLWSTDLLNWHASGQTVGGVSVTIGEQVVDSGAGLNQIKERHRSSHCRRLIDCLQARFAAEHGASPADF
ncbi:MAG: choice-of-anchor D domain-containing protein, partial [Candidatus Competibacteraceae bacterium]|nr:choice-of-anchor D domain-containing protein [Candidatus Competibacteraceae bacterium]